jgi:hypothetical protein
MCPQCGTDPTTGRGGPVQHSGPRVAPGWRRLVRYLAIATGVGLAFVAVLRVLGGIVASTTGWATWYEGIVALVAVVAILIGVGIASGAGVRVRLRRGREAPPDPYHGLSILACGLVVLVVGLAFVPGSKGVLDPGATPDPHWAGYETSAAARSVAANWTEPAIAAATGGENGASFWVGLGGQVDARLAQVGTDADDQVGQPPVYSAWYEMYPKPAYALDPRVLRVHPGDRLSASVTEVSSGRFRLAITNHTTHQQFATVQTDLGIPTTDGAIIAELPTAPHPLSLASFGTVRFTGCTVDGQPLADEPMSMFEIYRHGTTQARTSPIGADESSFEVSRQTVVHSPSPTTTPTIAGGIQGLAGVLTPTGTPAPATTTSDTMTPSAYRQVVAHDRAMLIRDLASIARAGAGGVIDGAAFDRLSNDCQTAGIDSETDLPPDSLSQLASRWNTAINVAALFGQPGSGIVLDLRGTRKPAAAVLGALERVQAGGEAGTVAQIAADLQQGLWVRKAYKASWRPLSDSYRPRQATRSHKSAIDPEGPLHAHSAAPDTGLREATVVDVEGAFDQTDAASRQTRSASSSLNPVRQE